MANSVATRQKEACTVDVVVVGPLADASVASECLGFAGLCFINSGRKQAMANQPRELLRADADGGPGR